jgi:hypothetical protein
MRKSIVMALAAGALAAAGAASAQGVFNYGGGYPGLIRGIAEAEQYGYNPAAGPQSYIDQNGRQVYVDGNGNLIAAVPPPSGPVAYDQWGRPVYGTYDSYGNYAYNNPNYAYNNPNYNYSYPNATLPSVLGQILLGQ